LQLVLFFVCLAWTHAIVLGRTGFQSLSCSCILCCTRCMYDMCWLAKARAYAVGLYVDDQAIEKIDLDKLNQSQPAYAPSPNDTPFEKAFLASRFTKALCLIFVNNIAGDHIARGLEK